MGMREGDGKMSLGRKGRVCVARSHIPTKNNPKHVNQCLNPVTQFINIHKMLPFFASLLCKDKYEVLETTTFSYYV